MGVQEISQGGKNKNRGGNAPYVTPLATRLSSFEQKTKTKKQQNTKNSFELGPAVVIPTSSVKHYLDFRTCKRRKQIFGKLQAN